MHALIKEYNLKGQFRWISSHTNRARNGELYRYIADTGGAFVQPALTVVEVMTCGLSTFATIHGGPAEIIEHGIFGYHIDPYHSEQMAAIVADFFQCSKEDPSYWKKITDGGLKRIPKDFDVITTSNLKQIKRQFHSAQIVRQRFATCMVHIKGSVIEVSSFETVVKVKHSDKEVTFSQMPKGCDKKDFIRWRNSMHRDFIINNLFFDPLSNKIFDYANGMADLRSLKVRLLGSAKLSFKEDCARILRGLRIVACLSLSIPKETETTISMFSSSILTLATSRIMMEMNYMLSYGAAEPSLCLLWRFNLLRVLLPIHVAYLDEQSIRKFPHNSTMLMKLFFNLDKVVTVDRPSDCSLWVALLAFHMALVSHPQDAPVRQCSSDC
ncbi:putative sucrose synthase [Rosa chinensis]|uniref:Putative sucrose synthase n=1 Tax=Rosa chinensis TaxID=74649 RepID=A0A2P6R9Q4_ROSCH|nr:putative sucrose synthase [Rosa chinensis]